MTDNAPLHLRRQGVGLRRRLPHSLPGHGAGHRGERRHQYQDTNQSDDLFPRSSRLQAASWNSSILTAANLLPVITGQQQTPRLADGTPRDTVYFHYPVLNIAFSTIRRGP